MIVTAAPLELKFDDGQGPVTLTDPNGNTVTLDGSGITLANGQRTGRRSAARACR